MRNAAISSSDNFGHLISTKLQLDLLGRAAFGLSLCRLGQQQLDVTHSFERAAMNSRRPHGMCSLGRTEPAHHHRARRPCCGMCDDATADNETDEHSLTTGALAHSDRHAELILVSLTRTIKCRPQEAGRPTRC